MKTFSPSPSPETRRWYVVDASEHTLGRLSSNVARVLRGKHKRDFSPHLDLGDFVIIVNAEKVKVTGRKLTDKMYYRHSGFPGGLRTETLSELRSRRPERVIEQAVRGMLPDNKLGDAMYRKLKVYAGPRHPHAAQTPITWNVANEIASIGSKEGNTPS